MTHPENFYVYIVASKSGAIYIGRPQDLERRIYEHKMRLVKGHTSRYHEDRLVYLEHYSRADDSITREKQLKGWIRSKKNALIEAQNPEWKDLSECWNWTLFKD